jgi:ATP-dependent DNA ligase
VFYASDLLHLDGRDVQSEPLVKRRAWLPKLIGDHDPTIRLSRDLPGTISAIVQALRATGIEGLVAKRKDSIYQLPRTQRRGPGT